MPEFKPGVGMPSIWYETMGDSNDDPLVLLHGFTQTHHTWDQLGQRLAKNHFLVLPDLPGHGSSGVPSSTAEMGIGPTSDAIAEVIRVAARQGGNGKVGLLGYSLGGRIALDLACKRQELLSCLILEGASPGIESDDKREERRAKDNALAGEIESRGIEWFVDYWQETALFTSQKRLPESAFQRIRRDRLSNSAHGLAMSLRSAGTGVMKPLWKTMEGVRIPVLLVAGERDRKYAQTAEFMRSTIPGSVFAKVKGAGHCPHLEKPEEFADLVERFLDNRSVVLRAAED